MNVSIHPSGYEDDAGSDSDTSLSNYRVEPDENETIRDVNLNGVITSLMNRVTIIFMSLLEFPTTSVIRPVRYDCLLRKLQMMRELMTTLQYIVGARESPVEFPEPGSVGPYADPRRRDVHERSFDGPLR